MPGGVHARPPPLLLAREKTNVILYHRSCSKYQTQAFAAEMGERTSHSTDSDNAAQPTKRKFWVRETNFYYGCVHHVNVLIISLLILCMYMINYDVCTVRNLDRTVCVTAL